MNGRPDAELTLGRGIRVGHNAVAMQMQRAGIAGCNGARKWRGVPGWAPAGGLVNRQFRRNRPNELWLTNITAHSTREGNVYWAVVLEVFSRRIVGWSISHGPTAGLSTNALGIGDRATRLRPRNGDPSFGRGRWEVRPSASAPRPARRSRPCRVRRPSRRTRGR